MPTQITTRANLDAAAQLGAFVFQIAALEGAAMFEAAPHIKREIEVELDGTTARLNRADVDDLFEELADAKDALINALRNSARLDDRITWGLCLNIIAGHYGSA